MAITLSTTPTGVRSSGATLQIAFVSANAAGSFLTCQVMTNGGVTAASTITDSAGNLWLLAGDASADGVNPFVQHWYAANAAGSTNTVTITNSVASQSLQCSAHEWAGVATSAPHLVSSSHASNAASTHTPGAVSGTPSTTLYLVTYGFSNAFDISTDPTGYTALNSTFTLMQSFFRVFSGSTTTENPEAGSSATETSANLISVFSGAAAAATSSKRRQSLSLLGVS